MLKMPTSRLEDLFSAVSGSYALYIPVEKDGGSGFEKWESGTKAALHLLHTTRSAKDLFFPQSENLVAFKTKGKAISIIENRDESKPFVLFGVRACDAASFSILDRVFLAQPVDTYYKARRESGVVVTLLCDEPERTCFCSAFGIDAANPGGDVASCIVGGTLYWNSLTEKGAVLTKMVREFFEEADASDETMVENYKNEMKNQLGKLPLQGLRPDVLNARPVREVFGDRKWEELSQACIGCGTCTFVCPTCQCYDIRDYDTGHGILRFRCWDSCMYSDFTKMAAGNPRFSRVERFRQRFMHKLVYFPANNDGVYACVGCGRCLSKCPVSMNIVKVVRTFGESLPEERSSRSDESAK